MDKPRQFSLAYLFLILFWAAVAAALLRLFPYAAEGDSINPVLLLGTAFLTALGTAVGGFFKKMRIGAAVGCSLAVILVLFFWSLCTLVYWLFELVGENA